MEAIIVNDTEKLGCGRANSVYQNGKIVLDHNNIGGVMSVYFGDELFHDLKQTVPKQANELQAFILDLLKIMPIMILALLTLRINKAKS